MKIQNVTNNERTSGLFVKAVITKEEFRQLSGDVDNLMAFPTNKIAEPVRVIKTGARHNRVRYLLLPVKLRKKFNLDQHDLDNVKCNAFENNGRHFIVYCIESKGLISNQ